MQELVDFVLKCTGCDFKVETQDIEDVDNVPSKLGELQDEYQQAKLPDYPLISKLKGYVGFRAVLTEFFSAIIHAMHASSVLYTDTALFENIQIWVDTMSSAGIRPFRHTATVMSLTIQTALCAVAQQVQGSITTTRGQIDTEAKKKKSNEARVTTMRTKLEADEKKLETIDATLQDEFDVVFVHRYRDVDAKIRVECVTALGTWITTYRQKYLDGAYLRYLGWVLSDTVFATRAEVVKQLKLLFKNPRNIAALRAFTDRFRPRMIEMAARDAEPGVRADTIELLDRLREAELLEPDDIDTIGQLIFDAEPRVRKAVAKFFVSNIEDLFKANTEDFDKKEFKAALPVSSQSYDNPTQDWITFKCLAQTLVSYDTDDDPDKAHGRHVLSPTELDSRYMLATQSIFPYMKVLHEWESLAGYLLYDHSQIDEKPDEADLAATTTALFKLGEREDVVLLEVLYYAVKLELVQIAESHNEKRGKKAQRDQDDILRAQELVATNLTQIIPKLLNKFGTVPQAAAAILRLEHLLDADLVNDIAQGGNSFSKLLDDVNSQFMTHSDRHVLAEASIALMNARKFEQSKETADGKLQEMWDDALSTIQNLIKGQSIDTRGTLSSNILTELSHALPRIASLASVADCATVLEGKFPATASKKQKGNTYNLSPLDFLLQLCKRGVPDEDTTADFAALEDDLAISTVKTILFYFMWKVQVLRAALLANETRALNAAYFADLETHKAAFAEVLEAIITARTPLDPVRLTAINAVLDVFTLFSTLRHIRPAKGPDLDDELAVSVHGLIDVVPPPTWASVMATHEKLEKAFAKRSRRKLEAQPAAEPGEDDAPIDSDAEDDEDEDEEEVGEGKDAKKEAMLMAEQSLCDVTGKIVLAVVGRVVEDGGRVRERLVRNKGRLGPNYKAVLEYLEDPAEKKSKGKSKKNLKVGGKVEVKEGKRKSEPLAVEEDDIEDSEMEGEGDDVRRDEQDEEVLREQGLAEQDDIDEPEGRAETAEVEELEQEPEDVMGD